jgi:acetyl esterase
MHPEPKAEEHMLDPQSRGLLDQMAASGQPPLHQLPPDIARQAIDAVGKQLGGPPESVAVVRDLTIPGPGGPIAGRLYIPIQGPPPPVVIYFHGGGFVVGSVEGWDSVLRALANASGCAVVSVDYRLAPEHPFPAAVDDAYATLEWVAREAASLGIDGSRIAVAGDSAGGNLAAVVSLLARDRNGPKIALQLLVYPAVAEFSRSKHASYEKYGENHFIDKDMIRWFGEQYVPPNSKGDWRIEPLHADSLRDLPPAHVIVAECDPLADEGALYADRLRAEGGTATFVSYPGMLHGFFTFPAVFDQGRQAISDAGAVLREALTASPATTSA